MSSLVSPRPLVGMRGKRKERRTMLMSHLFSELPELYIYVTSSPLG